MTPSLKQKDRAIVIKVKNNLIKFIFSLSDKNKINIKKMKSTLISHSSSVAIDNIAAFRLGRSGEIRSLLVALNTFERTSRA